MLTGASFGLFMLLWVGVMAVGFGGYIVGIVALIDVAQHPMERFGPWWDNVRQVWIIGIAVSFLLPLGPLVTGILWFGGGRRGLRTSGVAGRPFWAGPPKPPPPWGPTPPGSAAPPGPVPPAWGPPPHA